MNLYVIIDFHNCDLISHNVEIFHDLIILTFLIIMTSYAHNFDISHFDLSYSS